MNNVLKFALLVIGAALVGYGIFTLLSPQVLENSGPVKEEVAGGASQSWAMITFGILAMAAGFAFRRR